MLRLEAEIMQCLMRRLLLLCLLLLCLLLLCLLLLCLMWLSLMWLCLLWLCLLCLVVAGPRIRSDASSFMMVSNVSVLSHSKV